MTFNLMLTTKSLDLLCRSSVSVFVFDKRGSSLVAMCVTEHNTIDKGYLFEYLALILIENVRSGIWLHSNPGFRPLVMKIFERG